MKIDERVDEFLWEIESMRGGIYIGDDEKGKPIVRKADIIDYISCMIKYGYYERGHERVFVRNVHRLSRAPYKTNHPSAARAMEFVSDSKTQLFSYENDVQNTKYTIKGRTFTKEENEAIFDQINNSKLPNNNYRVFTAALRRAANGYELIPECARAEQSQR